MANRNRLLVPGVQQAIDQMKYEIAQEFGVQLYQIQLREQTVLSVAR